MTTIKCISPIDGSVYAERATLSRDEATAAVTRATRAQADWAARPLADRIAIVRAAKDKLNGMKDRIVTELAWQMGRPVRYGGEFGGFNERLDYMADIAEPSLADLMIEDSASFRRFIRRAPHPRRAARAARSSARYP